MTLTHAFAKSSNSVAVQLTREVGPQKVARVAHRLGITSTLQPVPALALGTSEVSPLELVTGYAAFANGGRGVIPHVITRIRTPSGKVLFTRRSSGFGQVMSAQSNAEMTVMMMRVISDGTGAAGRLSRPVAGKTGTSQDYRDAWFVGFTSNLVCGVWIGNDDNTTMKRATGGGLPARIFKSFMVAAEKGVPVQPLAGQRVLIAEAPRAVVNDAGMEATQGTSASSPDEQPVREKKDVLDAFQSLLDSIF
jgi:penicillin-binding protein 1A